jgi:hypothetical protein
MKKINRRDYLISMGAGAAGVIAAAELNAFGKGQITDRILENTEFDSKLSVTVPDVCLNSWPCTTESPGDNPGVRLVFAGMVAFTYKNTGQGTEGRAVFHRGHEHHQMKVIVYKGSQPNCVEIYRNEAVPKNAHFNIQVEDTRSDVKFFTATTRFSRGDLQGDDKDFRWLLDLEAPPFANGKPRTAKMFSTKLHLGRGTFYTYRHTGSTFYYINSRGVREKLGYVPKVMAADITLQNDECLSFKIGSKDVLTTPICRGQKYEIFFLNEYAVECPDRKNKKCYENDFGMVFDAFKHPAPFGLELVEEGHDNGPTTDLCLPLPTPLSRLTDEAPCMGGGFGGGGGFP